MLLPIELRKRVMSAVESGESVTTIHETFDVARSTIYSWKNLSKETGSLEPRPHAGGQRRKVDHKGIKRIEKIHKKEPDITMEELMLKYNEKAEVEVSRSTISRVVAALGLTRKKNFSSD